MATDARPRTSSKCLFQSEHKWLDLTDDHGIVNKPKERIARMKSPTKHIDNDVLDRIYGSMMGMTLGDALGAHVEFRPRAFLEANPVENLQGGGTWGLKAGQFTDDTSMALCLACSLICRRDFVLYDQLVRYKWWYRHGYMSSTGECFDIGAATKKSLEEFERRQKRFMQTFNISKQEIDYLNDPKLLKEFEVYCSDMGVAGNGALMRLAPVPLFFFRDPDVAVEYSGRSGKITHGDIKAYDACRYYGALIVAAVRGESREELLDTQFYYKHKNWFSRKELDPDILRIAEGSYQKGGEKGKGIRGRGYIVDALEAALWAFWQHGESFEKGALAAVNLGDDTDTTAAIYGQLAGAVYGYSKLSKDWVKKIYAKEFIECLSRWILFEGEQWSTSYRRERPIEMSSASERNRHETHGSGQAKKSSTGAASKDHSLKGASASNASRDRSPNYLQEQGASVLPTGAGGSTLDKDSNLLPYQHGKVKSEDDVGRWLQDLGSDYGQYAGVFKEKFVDGFWLLNHVGEEDLKKYGITDKKHREKILKGIKKLQGECPDRELYEQRNVRN